MAINKTVSKENILQILEERFNQNLYRHPDMDFKQILSRLTNKHIDILYNMELTGGEPDVVLFDEKTNTYVFMDCVTESPLGRRSLCYDTEALEKRKQNKPHGSAQGLAKEMGITLLTYEEFISQKLQPLIPKLLLASNPKTSFLRGALYGEYRYKTIFLGHNEPIYYGTRGFRAH